MSSELQGREVKIPVPWGEIAGREWGQEDGVPWIALHGWLDNAGSFEPLVSHFPSGHRILCLDLPGHGLSSPIPKGLPYLFLESIGHVHRVAKHQGWESFGLLGHSMGAGIASLYAATFPEHVKVLIMLDLIKPVSRRVDELVARTRDAILGSLDMENKANRPEKVYPTYEAALNRLIENSVFIHGKDNVTEEAAKIILKRGAKQVEGGWMFTRDRRLQITSLYGLPADFLKEFASKIQCPHLLIKAKSQCWDAEQLNREILELYSANPRYQFQAVQGSHHVHLTSPELVAPSINTFLSRNQDCLTNNTDGNK